MSLARETLSSCTGNVDEMLEKISSANGSRRQRMCYFLQLVLQDKEKLSEFEKILKKNGLKKVIGKLLDHIRLQYVEFNMHRINLDHNRGSMLIVIKSFTFDLNVNLLELRGKNNLGCKGLYMVWYTFSNSNRFSNTL